VYVPVFIDLYLVDEKRKGLWLALVNITSPIGTSIGYVGTGIITSYGGHWWYFFSFIIITCAVFFVILMLIPDKYIELSQVLKEKRRE
jgi:MFS family permease